MRLLEWLEGWLGRPLRQSPNLTVVFIIAPGRRLPCRPHAPPTTHGKPRRPRPLFQPLQPHPRQGAGGRGLARRDVFLAIPRPTLERRLSMCFGWYLFYLPHGGRRSKGFLGRLPLQTSSCSPAWLATVGVSFLTPDAPTGNAFPGRLRLPSPSLPPQTRRSSCSYSSSSPSRSAGSALITWLGYGYTAFHRHLDDPAEPCWRPRSTSSCFFGP